MIYLQHTDEEQTVLVPIPAEAGGGRLELVLKSSVNLTEARFGDGSRSGRSLYAEFPVALPQGAPEGSYEYRVEEGGETVASGVAQVGEYGSGDVQYERDTAYEQYDGSKE